MEWWQIILCILINGALFVPITYELITTAINDHKRKVSHNKIVQEKNKEHVEKYGLNEEKERYAEYLMKEAKLSIEYEDALDFSDLLLHYTIVGKEKTLNRFYDFTKRFFRRFGVISPMTIANISYFTGVLNANGIISNKEMEDMNADLINTIQDTINNNK